MVYLLFSGIYQVFKFKNQFGEQPIFWMFLTIIILLSSIPFLLTQSFVQMGDKTIASALLFISTSMLPFGLLASFGHQLKIGMPKILNKIDFLAILFSLQWTIVLFFSGLIPFRIWI